MDVSTGKLHDALPDETRKEAADRLRLEVEQLVMLEGERAAVERVAKAVASARQRKAKARRRASNKQARRSRKRNR